MFLSSPSIKILVGFHKPATMLKNDIFFPIHLGRALMAQALKEGTLSKKDAKWLLNNMIGDDTGENISSLNPHFAEMTAVYWAWKNYHELGNPQYIGFSHYRRILPPDTNWGQMLRRYDIAAFKNINLWGENNKAQFRRYHHNGELEKTCHMLKKQNPQMADCVQAYLNQKWGYYCNIFVMPKDHFFSYCEWLFPQLFDIHQRYNYDASDSYNKRMPAFIAERLTGIYLSYLSRQGCKVAPISPLFIPADLLKFRKCCFNAANIWINYLYYVIKSAFCRSKKRKKYRTKKEEIKQILDKKNTRLH